MNIQTATDHHTNCCTNMTSAADQHNCTAGKRLGEHLHRMLVMDNWLLAEEDNQSVAEDRRDIQLVGEDNQPVDIQLVAVHIQLVGEHIQFAGNLPGNTRQQAEVGNHMVALSLEDMLGT